MKAVPPPSQKDIPVSAARPESPALADPRSLAELPDTVILACDPGRRARTDSAEQAGLLSMPDNLNSA